MIPLLPVGGIVDPRFGILTAPNHKGVPAGIVAGLPWAADLGCLDGPEWVKRFDQQAALKWLDTTMVEYRETCLFVTVPDVVGDAVRTWKAFHTLAGLFPTWPIAYIAQDGYDKLAEYTIGYGDYPLPTSWRFEALFVGGSTEWKLGDVAYSVIREAQQLGKHIHIGRVNWWNRWRHFAVMEGSDDWTCDGTRTRFDGTRRTVAAWAGYMAQRPLLRRVSDRDYRSEFVDDVARPVGDAD